MKNIIYSTPVINKQDARNNTRFWVGHVLLINEQHFTLQEYWQTTKDGSDSIHQWSEPILVNGKNIGKSNETTPEQQAISQITSLYNKKIDEGYFDMNDSNQAVVFLPMLAHKFERSKRVTFPAYCQAKYDGCRAFRLPDGSFWSRKGKQILPTVVQHLNHFNVGDIILDGELMLPVNEYTFQQTISAVKKYSDLSLQLNYYIYDCFIPSKPHATFEERRDRLEKETEIAWLFNCKMDNVTFIQTDLVNSLDEFELIAASHIGRGYEGAMYRSISGVYEVNKRSYNLLKYKEFIDEEFTIVDVSEGVGGDAGCAIFTCVTPEGKDFNVRPKASIEERRHIFSNASHYMNKSYTVRFHGYTDDGKPRFPVGIGLRDYE
jgi:DNA ligase-1